MQDTQSGPRHGSCPRLGNAMLIGWRTKRQHLFRMGRKTPFRMKKQRMLKVRDFQGAYAWLGREDSNLRMGESKSPALPLGDAPTDGLESGGAGLARISSGTAGL